MTTRQLLYATAAIISMSLGAGPLGPSVKAQTPGRAPSTPEWPTVEMLRSRRLAAEGRALFSAEAPLPITLKADFKAVNRDRNVESTALFPATLSVAKRDGSIASVPVKIRTRGHVRRMQRTCSFAPLRIEFDAATVAGTIFEGHRALKLGTHCREADLYEQYMPREYVAYRIFNLLTPRSFRARLVDASYLDAAGKKFAERQALFIEDDDDVARRMEGRITDTQKIVFSRLDRETLTLMTLFEYMIGNTDVSIYVQHNARVVQTPNNTLFPIPYDFDYSGLVNARYAVPAKALNLVSVVERAYMGPCRPVAELAPHFEHMRSVKDKVMDVVATVPGLSEGYRKDATKYLEKFYETIEKPRLAKEAFVDRCNKVGM